MRDHPERDTSIEQLAGRYGYSKYHFSREFKKILGVSPNEYWAALKMEQSFIELEHSSILNAQLKVGYQSTGTFATSFRKITGLTPSQYKEELENWHMCRHVKEYEEKGERIYTHYSFDRKDLSTMQANNLTVTCKFQGDFAGWIFVGLYPKFLSIGAPVLGKALYKTNRCIIDQIPNGEHYLGAFAIPSSNNLLTYFQSKFWLREFYRDVIRFPLEAPQQIEFVLREQKPTDLALTLNPMKLLFEAMRQDDCNSNS